MENSKERNIRFFVCVLTCVGRKKQKNHLGGDFIKKNNKQRNYIKKSLNKFVEENYSADVNDAGFMYGLIDDYLYLYDIKAMLADDIEKRGVNYECFNAKGESSFKKNESIADYNRTEQTMIRIQVQIGIRTSGGISKEGYGDLL